MSALVRNFRSATLRKRLWMGFGIIAVIFATAAAANPFLSKDKAVHTKMLFHDFLAFYTAGTFVREGHADNLYKLEAVRDFQKELAARENLEIGKGYGPFWNPPFYAWVFVPIAGLPYPQAAMTWVCINVVCGAAAVFLLCRMLGGTLTDKLLVPALMIVSMPFLMAINHAQNTLTSLLLLTLTVTAWRSRRAVLAGLAAGLLFYKPQLGAIIAMMLVLTLGWRAIVGLAVTGTTLLVITLVTMPGSLEQYLHQLPINVRVFQVENTYLWERHATLMAFWRLMFQGRAAGEMLMIPKALWWLTAGGLGLALLAAAIRSWRDRGETPSTIDPRTQLDRLIAATIVTMPLLMPFYFDYDLLLISIPAVLLAAEKIRLAGNNRPAASGPLDRWLIGVWVVMVLFMPANPYVGERTGLNITVLLLSCVAGLLIARSMTRRPRTIAAMDAYPLNVREAT